MGYAGDATSQEATIRLPQQLDGANVLSSPIVAKWQGRPSAAAVFTTARGNEAPLHLDGSSRACALDNCVEAKFEAVRT